ncbi:MAG TPA: S41 family peptidase [Dysgonamonadaceae bacterium]|mgnify:CR=1 FL=1|nr:peptidase S41 [Dysgonamonadaceae bacterium]HOM63586.1 S41 family peptidase [Dysgonamonadaceae bacterium]HRU13594.1 S41 family peptidase [Dysgonamonadaceae bacterium]
MNKKIIALLFTLFLISTEGFGQLRPSLDGLKLERTLQLIKNLYVDDVDSEKLTETAIRAMLSDLDPHSSYLDKEEVKAMNEPLQGDFEGIGISFNMLTDTLYVMEVISGGPSQKVGILPGDKILYVNDTLIAGVKMNTNDVIKKLRGPKGTEVKVKVLRRNTPQLLEFRIVRDKIPIYSIDASYMVDDHTGYIRLSRFAATSTDEFRKAENALLAAGMTNLILDLTGNGGGILQTATDITDEFLEKGKLIVYTEGKNQPRYSINSTDKGNFKKGNLVVLVDEGSASASEILSGAVQDWDRGVIVGRRTFGKGLVQRQLPLPDGTMIRLTVARYYTPTGRSIQKPYENGDLDSYNMDVLNRYNRGELIHADSIHFPDSLKYKTLVNKRTVYGGGGIMPDYFVPIDTTTLTNLHRDLIAKGVVNRISISEVDKNRNALLANYPDVEIFKKKYEITPEMVDNLKQMALSDSIKWDDEQFERSRDFLFTQLKALIARDLYNSSAYFRIMNDENEIFKEAFRIINNEKRYNSLLKGLGDKVSNPNS